MAIRDLFDGAFDRFQARWLQPIYRRLGVWWEPYGMPYHWVSWIEHRVITLALAALLYWPLGGWGAVGGCAAMVYVYTEEVLRDPPVEEDPDPTRSTLDDLMDVPADLLVLAVALTVTGVI